MPIGKDSITKRVAKTATEEKNIAPELVATVAAAPAMEKKAPAMEKKAPATEKKASATEKKAPATEKKAPAKKTASGTAKKTSSAAKKSSASTKKATAKDKTETITLTPPTAVDEKLVDTAVLANVAPETVAAVIGHKEDEKYEKVQLGQKLPSFLL